MTNFDIFLSEAKFTSFAEVAELPSLPQCAHWGTSPSGGGKGLGAILGSPFGGAVAERLRGHYDTEER